MQTHILGFPSMGGRRELKKALESFWKGDTTAQSLVTAGQQLQERHWNIQRHAGLDYVTTGDFSFYDRMLDTTLMLGAIPARFASCACDAQHADLARYFAMARGDVGRNIPALEMTKWFDTNYHYLVPELEPGETWTPQEHPVLEAARRALSLGFRPKAALVGPFTWLALAKARNGATPWALLDTVLERYATLLASLAPLCPIVQMEEPVLCTELLPPAAAARFAASYRQLNAAAGSGKLLLASYFGPLTDQLLPAVQSGCAVLHLDLVRGASQLDPVLASLPESMSLSLGVVDGRNIWKTDYTRAAAQIERVVSALGPDRVWLASSCSLLHCPVDITEEKALPAHIKARMAFAVQKCAELADLRSIAEGHGAELLADNDATLRQTRAHPDTLVPGVRQRASAITPAMLHRHSPYARRHEAQAWLNLPLLPATTIGSFPQTPAIRQTRLAFRQGRMDNDSYVRAIKEEIKFCVEKQEALGLDVLVHGEAERNDMVEYFGQQMGGFCFTANGWVQSYGSRCVKPPVIYGDVYRKAPMTVDWSVYAQSLTQKPMKGMLTGPVTILCWSFVRDDLPRADVCRQIALAIRDEVMDLESAGIGIIQIDEAALREGMPLNSADAAVYLRWAVDAFRLTTSGVADKTQIHSHMCYSEFNAILPAIAEMDADVISIESSRSGMELLDAFTRFTYENEVGPGVYDIHSPRVPSEEEIADLLRKALRHIPEKLLWVNPDCGLKTRRWEEVWPSLQNMVAAALRVRKELGATAK